MSLAEASADPVEAITEADAQGVTAAIFADIRGTLDVAVVNLIWRHLATMPGALEWVWPALKPLYRGPALAAADDVRRQIALPNVMRFSDDTLAAAGLDGEALANIRNILDSYYHTNALALVVFSAFLGAVGGGGGTSPRSTSMSSTDTVRAPRTALPRLTPVSEMVPPVARLVDELNSFGEDADTALVASMYRHLSHWPSYLALTRTVLLPLHRDGELLRLVAATRLRGEEHGRKLAPLLSLPPPPERRAAQAIAAVRRFVDHPIARMTGICALMRGAMPEH